jgi:glucose-1-phosphate thymidylyltransferase
MKGIVMAGGKATRLRPLTEVTNKHLLPIYNKPLIFYPLEAMVKAGITEVMIVTNPEHAGHFMNLLRSGQKWGLRLSYEIQEEARGMAEVVGLAEPFARGSKVLVLAGDNIFTQSLRPSVDRFRELKRGAMTFAKVVDEPQHYGVVELEDGKVISIVEKPQRPKSPYAQMGIYMYDERVFDFVKRQTPSGRGELEITDLNNFYVQEGTCYGEILDGYWIDVGVSFEELLAANNTVADLVRRGEL